MELQRTYRLLAERQLGLMAIRQAREVGATVAGVRDLRRSPEWDPVSRRVLRLVGSPRSPLQLAAAAVLDAGAAATASFDLASALWELPGFDLSCLRVSRPREIRRPSAGLAALHLPNDLTEAHVTERYGIRVTTLARTLFDVAYEIHPMRLEKLVDRVVTLSPSTLDRLHELFLELGGRGKDGTVAMRAILDARPPGYVPPASALERRVMTIFERAGMRPMRRQVNLGGDEWIGRFDFVDDPPWVVLEVDSRTYHSSITDVQHDARRDARLREAGFLEIVRAPEDDVWHHPERILLAVDSARRRARQRHRLIA